MRFGALGLFLFLLLSSATLAQESAPFDFKSTALGSERVEYPVVVALDDTGAPMLPATVEQPSPRVRR